MPDLLEPVASSTSAALEHVRQVVALCRERAEELARSAPAAPFRSIGIVGAGIMGAAIAREHAARGLTVVLCDSDPEALRRASCICNGGPVRCTQSLADLAGCDLVLESIAEKRAAKQSLYAQLMPHVRQDGILGSNTSTIPITRLASRLAEPECFCGLHFCHPVRLRPLVEIIPGAATSRDTLARLTAHVLALGRLPLIVGDGPGFVVNRLLMSYLSSALAMLAEGESPATIDEAMTSFGMTMGPFAQLDEIGLDTALQCGVVLSEIGSERSAGTEVLVWLVKSRQLGVKSGGGIYCYPQRSINPALEKWINTVQGKSTTSLDAKLIVSRLLMPIVAEATRLLEEKKAAFAWQIDLATIFGLGSPCWKGGLLWWANSQRMVALSGELRR